MKTEKQTIDRLIDEFTNHLLTLGRSRSTIRLYRRVWFKVKSYMDSNKIRYFNKKVGEQYLKSILGLYEYSKLDYYGKNIVNRVQALDEFQDTGTITSGKRAKPPRLFTGPIGSTMSSYIADRKNIYGLSDATLNNYNIYMHRLLDFLKSNNINSINQITGSDLISFINSIDPKKLATKHVALSIIKNYFSYLFKNGLSVLNYSSLIPKDNYKDQPHLPSTFTKEEISELLTVVDRSSPKGRRDYAILLLAIKLGIRSSDIRRLKFENIIWDKNIIEFQQQKTGKKITLPLLGEIGNAIIEYLKHGRPISSLDFIFLQLISPYKQMDKSGVSNLVAFYLKRTNINCKNRRHGPHALRHSFAMSLLSNKTPLPVISESLGHARSESTMFYLRIDNDSLRQCALAVPPVDSSFYEQKGGLNHD